MTNTRFTKGDFITQKNDDSVFAIWSGNEYHSDDDNTMNYSLFAYYDPTNVVEDGKNKSGIVFKSEPIFDIATNGNDCNYVVAEDDITYWRHCTNFEINKILKFLAEKGYKWVNKLSEIQKMSHGEKLVLCDSEFERETVLKKKWNRQRFPISLMDSNKRHFIIMACQRYNKVKYPPTSYHGSYSNNSFTNDMYD